MYSTPEKRKAYYKQYYEKNKQKIIAAVTERKQQKRHADDEFRKSDNERLRLSKIQHGRKEVLYTKTCERCGEIYGVPKRKLTISRFCSRGCSRGGSKNTRYRELALDTNLRCGCGVETKYLLTVHHIDGNHKNNSPDNWEVVCFNCHGKRHLRQRKDLSWVIDYSCLTPRDLLNAF